MALKYLNLTGLTNLVTDIMNWVTSRIPTKTSEIDNDSGFITASDLPTNHVTTNTTQTITSTKTFQNTDINLKQTGITLGTTPSSNQYRRVQSLDNSNIAFAQLVYVQRNDGNTYIELRAGDKFTSGAKATSGTQVWSDFQVGTSSDGNKYIYTDALWSNSLVPYGNNTSSLGNATHRWTNVYGTVRLDPSAGATADLLYSQMAANDLFRLQVGGTRNNGYVEIATADDGNEPIYVRQYKGVFATLQRTLTLLDGSGNTTLPGTLNAVSYKLNGTAFGDIVTHNASEFLTSHQSLTNYATKSYVDTSVANLVNSAPTTLDTLNELATALGNDPNFATTVATSIGTKANDSDVVHLAGTETVTGSKTFSNPINSSYNSSTWLNANNGGAIINSTATAGDWACIAKTNSTNGHFTLGSHQANFYLNYTVGTETGNRTTKSVRLLDESGNSYFPGIIESGYVFGDGKAAFKAHINTATSAWSYGVSILNAAMSANQYIFCPIGKAYSTANCAGIRFQWVGNSSNDNNIGFEFYGTGSPLVVYKDGRAVLSASPDASDNSTRIATTAYVKSQGYITSSSSITGNAATATTAGNVTGTVAITNGGTGATTRVNAVKNLFNENIGSSPTHFLTGTANFANSGWSSIVDTKTALGITGDIGTHNASEFLTSHQSLDGCVKTTGNQLIAGWKQFTGDVCIKNTAITDHTVAPSENTGRSLGFWDNNNKYWGDLDHTYYTSGVSEMRLCLSNWTSSGSQGWWCLKFGVDKNFSQVYFIPNGDDGYNLGDSTHKWHYVYANSFKGTLSNNGDTISYTTAQALYYYSGQPAIANCVEGSSNDFTKFSYPTGATVVSSFNANIQSLRLVWGNTYWHEIFCSPNQRYLWHRDVRGGSAKAWTRLIEEDSTVTWGINIGGTASNVTGTVAIANGGTGATTRLNAVKALTNENVGLNTQYFLTITNNWGKCGYASVNDIHSVMGLIGKFSNVTKGTNPSSQTWVRSYIRYDSAGTAVANRLTEHRACVNTDGSVDTENISWCFASGSSATAILGVKCKLDGSGYAYCPNPPAADNTNSIATTKWVNDKGYITSSSNITGSSASCTGNAATATQFSANKSVTLTGDVTGTASSKAGWSVATTLANSGVTAGTYGPSADVTGNNNSTISVPQITVDAKGRVTSVTNRTLTCKNNTYNVYNKTLTIQKNGTNVATFTSNSNTNVTANIVVPTKVSELTNDSGFLTSHQSLLNYVTLNSATGNQSITGTKYWKTALELQDSNGTIVDTTQSTFANTISQGNINFEDGTTTAYGSINHYFDTDRSSVLEFNSYNKKTNGQGIYANVVLRNNLEGDAEFSPKGTGYVGLGSADHPWHTINGLNPGSLGLPAVGNANAYEIDTTGWDLTGRDIHVVVQDAYGQQVPGYLMIYIAKCAATDWVGIQLTSYARSAGVMCAAIKNGSYYYVKACFPCNGSCSVNIVKTAGTISYARLYPFIGNHGFTHPN